MQFEPTPLSGAYVIVAEPIADDRGYFARTWCATEFAEHGVDPTVTQMNLSHNRLRGTLRGMHFQFPPHAEHKLVRCVRGSLYDVIVDLRPRSPTFLQWFGVELSDANLRALFVPKGFGHGFQTLADDTLVLYQMSDAYAPAAAGSLRWDDPRLAIAWPLPVTTISPRDAAVPALDNAMISRLAAFNAS